MVPNKKMLIKSMVEFGSEAETKNLIWGHSGNISCRLDEQTYLITGSGAHLEKLNENDFVVMNLENEEPQDKGKPSIELKMHTEIYKIQKEANCVFHSQPFFTTLVSCTDFEVDTKLFPESMAYIEKIGRVEYNHPGSMELAKSVSEKALNSDIIILSNHGAICWAKSLDDALLKTETLEFLCKMLVFSRISDLKLNFLPQELKDDFLKHLSKLK
ncbi:MAG: class II aldolase/adducin family protein [Thermoplasmata archaeon]|nr:MAG: class II aldolase/adducin family protein [Thermoplasmata archaeon]